MTIKMTMKKINGARKPGMRNTSKLIGFFIVNEPTVAV